MRIVALGAISVPAFAGGPAVSASAAPDWKHCGHFDGLRFSDKPLPGAGLFHIRARQVSCHTARRIAKYHGRWNCEYYPAEKQAECWKGDWYCISRSTGYESGKTVCRASYGRRVRWLSGA